MLLLAFETSAKAASVALFDGTRLLGEQYQNTGLTHSQTLMVMAQELLSQCEKTPQDVEAVAVANGPGSFTGVRIGVAAAKGFAWGAELPLYGVSTLEAMALGLGMYDGIVCPVMDARRGQMYSAILRIEGETVTRVSEDRCVMLTDLIAELKQTAPDTPIRFCGSGYSMAVAAAEKADLKLAFTPELLRYEHAYGTALCAWRAYEADPACAVTDLALSPIYLRASQAERERLEREQAEQK